MWPAVAQTKPSKETETKVKLVKEVFAGATEQKDTLCLVFEKHEFWQTIRTTLWVARFICNCKLSKENRLSGPLTTHETDEQVKFGMNRTQDSKINTDQFHEFWTRKEGNRNAIH